MFPDFAESDSTLPLTSKSTETDDNLASTPKSKSDSTPPSTLEPVDAEDTTPVSTAVDHSETESKEDLLGTNLAHKVE